MSSDDVSVPEMIQVLRKQADQIHQYSWATQSIGRAYILLVIPMGRVFNHDRPTRIAALHAIFPTGWNGMDVQSTKDLTRGQMKVLLRFFYALGPREDFRAGENDFQPYAETFLLAASQQELEVA